jgi:hypothetical protein
VLEGREGIVDFYRVVAPLKKGQFVRGRVFVYYTLRDGRIAHVRVARASPMSEPQT